MAGGLNFTLGTGGGYGGLDRFGRVVSNKWQTDSAVVVDRFDYGYDSAGNRRWKENVQAAAKDELYAHDSLYRLGETTRGDLNAAHDAITNQQYAQAWTLDQLGNWTAFNDNGTAQTRTHNLANETTAVSNWLNPTHDLAGNMTLAPKPGAEATAAEGLLMIYDAWNRLRKVYKDANASGQYEAGTDIAVAEYHYDGKHRRIRKVIAAAGTTVTLDYYYDETFIASKA